MALRDCEEVVQKLGQVDCRFPFAKCPTNFSLSIVQFEMSVLSRCPDGMRDKLKFVGHSANRQLGQSEIGNDLTRSVSWPSQ